ncbi:MAG: hypothetical protein JW741_30130 [Sedimentisphaerales bacterium]|nr:hypothetical protein [Sedimentisphaerales bacterium]
MPNEADTYRRSVVPGLLARGRGPGSRRPDEYVTAIDRRIIVSGPEMHHCRRLQGGVINRWPAE